MLLLCNGPGFGGFPAPPGVPSDRHLGVGHILRPIRAEMHGVCEVAHGLQYRLQARRQGAGERDQRNEGLK